ncbi:hypothetical protein JXA32_13505 [Candidatus Sumerlaeota bacterium]|nr:hypothetical protein [Candidatus Sumerlaeota bacterium]
MGEKSQKKQRHERRRSWSVGQAWFMLWPLGMVMALYGVMLQCPPYNESWNVWPRFDAVQYALTAANWLRYGEPSILVGNNFYPGRYLFGYSLFLLPQLMFFGFDLTRLYCTTVVLSFISLAVFYGFVLDMFRSRWVAALSTAFMVSSPFWVRHSILIMTGVPAIGLLAGQYWILLRIWRDKHGGSWMHWLALGFLAGLLTTWRVTYAIPTIVLILHYFYYTSIPNFTVARNVSWLVISAGTLLSVKAVYAWIYYGDPTKTVYHYYENYFDPSFRTFDWRYAFLWMQERSGLMQGRDCGNLVFYLNRISGGVSQFVLFNIIRPFIKIDLPYSDSLKIFVFYGERFYSALIPLAAPFGAWRIAREWLAGRDQEKHVIGAWAWGSLVLFVIFLAFVYQQERLVNFIVPLMCLLAGCALAPYPRGAMSNDNTRQATNSLFAITALVVIFMHAFLMLGPDGKPDTAPEPLIRGIQRIKDTFPEGSVIFTNDSPSLIHHVLDGKACVLPFWDDYRDPILKFGSYEHSDFHVMAIEHLHIEPVKRWKEQYPIDRQEFLIDRYGFLNISLLDRLFKADIPCFVVLMLPRAYFNHGQFNILYYGPMRKMIKDEASVGIYYIDPYWMPEENKEGKPDAKSNPAEPLEK